MLDNLDAAFAANGVPRNEGKDVTLAGNITGLGCHLSSSPPLVEPDAKKAKREKGFAIEFPKLGLRAKSVDGKGQCFFNALAVLFAEQNNAKGNSALPTEPQAIRNLTVQEMRAKKPNSETR